MAEVKAEITGKNLVITIPLDDAPSESASGKSVVVASTRGFNRTDAKIKGKVVSVSVNAIIPVK